jgi:hypothetical protein
MSSFLDIPEWIFNSGLSALLSLKIFVKALIKELGGHVSIIIPTL